MTEKDNSIICKGGKIFFKETEKQNGERAAWCFKTDSSGVGTVCIQYGKSPWPVSEKAAQYISCC